MPGRGSSRVKSGGGSAGSEEDWRSRVCVAYYPWEFRCPPFFPSTKLVGLAIRHYLSYVGLGYPYEFYHCFRRVKPSYRYENARRYFYILCRLGLIERVEGVEGPNYKGGFRRHFYRIKVYDDPRWLAPQASLYPATRLGARKYRRLMEEAGCV